MSHVCSWSRVTQHTTQHTHTAPAYAAQRLTWSSSSPCLKLAGIVCWAVNPSVRTHTQNLSVKAQCVYRLQEGRIVHMVVQLEHCRCHLRCHKTVERGGGCAAWHHCGLTPPLLLHCAASCWLFRAVLCRGVCVLFRQDIDTSRQRYVFGEAQLARLNALLAQYEGTHNYHNYTVRHNRREQGKGKGGGEGRGGGFTGVAEGSPYL